MVEIRFEAKYRLTLFLYFISNV